jgi:putative DNA primase/helicase
MEHLNTSPSSNNGIQSFAVAQFHSVRDDVRHYLDQGYSPIPVRFQTKSPTVNAWTRPGLINASNVDQYFPDETNIGIVLGNASGGLVDIDIDAEDGLNVAPLFLPPTDMKFGRESRRGSHWIYKVPDAKKHFATKDDDGKNIVEVRGNEHQTVFPHSIHKSGERIEFEEEGQSEPGHSTWDELLRATLHLSLAIILLRHWKAGRRHQLSLAISGYLATCGWSREDVAKLISIVAREAKDEEMDDRLTSVKTTFEKYKTNEAVMGQSELEDLLKPKLVTEMNRWFGKTNRSLQVTASPGIAPTQSVPGSFTQLQNAIGSDVDLSEHLADQLQGKLIYCRTNERWFRRNKQVCVPISMTEVEGEIKDKLTQLADLVAPFGVNTSGLRRTLLTTTKINSLEHLLRSNPKITVDSRGFDRESLFLGCSDGSILGLDQRAILSRSDSIITKQLGTTLDPTAKCPRWEKFLARIFDGDTDLLSFIRRSVGYTLTGRGSERCLFVLIGNGANGKSTFLRVILKLFGDYGAGTPMHTLMSGRYGNEKTDDLAALPGKRFVQAQEAESGQRLAEAKIKMMTGGDSITCRALYGHQFTYDPQFVLWLATNEMPDISGGSDAVWERLRIIPFDVSIPSDERDLTLFDKLNEELPGILNWAIDGYHDWKENHLNPPDKVLRTVSGYREEKDLVAQWINEECIQDPSAKSFSKELYKTYHDWATANHNEPLSNIKFAKELERKGFKRHKTARANEWRGIGLRKNAEIDPTTLMGAKEG